MKIYIAKITNPVVIDEALSLSEFVHDGIYNFEQEMTKGDIVYIYFGGDKAQISWSQGLRGIGEISVAPYDKGYDTKNSRYFKIKIKPCHILPDSIAPRNSKIHKRLAEALYEMPYIGANHFPNQAISSSKDDHAIHALADLYAEAALEQGDFSAITVLKSMGVIEETQIADLLQPAIDALGVVGISEATKATTDILTALFTRRFSLLSGLSGSGKTLLARFVAKWLSSSVLGGFPATIKQVLKSHPDLEHYEVVSFGPDALELINTKGSSKKIIPLTFGALREWYEAYCLGKIPLDEKAQSAASKLKKLSRYQPYAHGFYNDYRAIAKAMMGIPPISVSGKGSVALIPVGANWTSKDDLLGYPDALRPGRFVKRPALELLIRAHENWKLTGGKEGVRPFFLILDEMNLSHVERYFSDFLSAMESGGEIELHDMANSEQDPDAGDNLWDGVPARIRIPGNLFVIGTVNVDETTYMFSPKVLDRANVIEFRADKDAISAFLAGKKDVDLDAIAGKGAHFGEAFVHAANMDTLLEPPYSEWLKKELDLMFEFLADHEGEFGFRTARAITRFVQFSVMLQGNPDDAGKRRKLFIEAMDAQIMQKILPKMHGSKKKLGAVLRGLAELCTRDKEKGTDGQGIAKARNSAINKLDEGSLLKEALADLMQKCRSKSLSGDVRYPVSFEKIVRMLRMLERDGFASFAEA